MKLILSMKVAFFCVHPHKKSRNRLLCYGITWHLAFPRSPPHPTLHFSSCSFHSSGTPCRSCFKLNPSGMSPQRIL